MGKWGKSLFQRSLQPTDLDCSVGNTGRYWRRLITITLTLLALAHTPATVFAAGAQSPDQLNDVITKIFPSSTTVGEMPSDLAVWPIFKQSELLGYAFQSVDFVDLRGFSGKPINLLVGIDPQGTFVGVEVLEHHEPMFNHDLVGAMERFVGQYQGLKVTDKVSIDNGSHGKSHTEPKEAGDGSVRFDGISKATISLAVINKTVLTSALHVARARLDAYKQRQTAVARNDLFEPLNWGQLLEKGLMRHWTITQERVERATGLYLEEYHDPDLDLSQPEANLEIYYGYLNTPTTGRNLLGERGYKRLMGLLKPGEHAFAFMSEGFYAYPGRDFIPGSQVERLFLEQHGLRIALQDMDFFGHGNDRNRPDVPGKDHLHIFKVTSGSELSPNAPMEMTFNMGLTLPNGKIIEARFQDSYGLPENLFTWVTPDTSEDTQAMWVSLWESRLIEIAVLCLALAVLTGVFLKQQAISKTGLWFHRFRWAFLFFTLFFIGFFAQGQLSVINIYTLLLELQKGFDINFFLLDPIIFILWVFTFASLILWGRGLFCGWLCPFGALQEMAAWLGNKLKLKQIRVPSHINRPLIYAKYLILAILVASAFYSPALSEKLAEVEPFKTSMTFYFVRSLPFVAYALLLLALGMFIHKFYCRYVCPLGAGLAILGRLRRFEWLNRRRECGSPCQVCRHRCGINAIDRQGSIDYDECIQCLECIVIINDDKQCAPAMVAAKRDAERPVRIIEQASGNDSGNGLLANGAS